MVKLLVDDLWPWLDERSGRAKMVVVTRAGLGGRTMDTANTIQQIQDQLQRLTSMELVAVLEFVTHLSSDELPPGVTETMLMSEDLLRRDWERPEEEAAWANL